MTKEQKNKSKTSMWWRKKNKTRVCTLGLSAAHGLLPKVNTGFGKLWALLRTPVLCTFGYVGECFVVFCCTIRNVQLCTCEERKREREEERERREKRERYRKREMITWCVGERERGWGTIGKKILTLNTAPSRQKMSGAYSPPLAQSLWNCCARLRS